MIFKKLMQLQHKKLIHRGFTLAEVMVVMAILGVLAAILIPTILTNTIPSNNKIMFKKAYHSLEQAITIMINDDINYPSEATFQVNGIYIPRGFNYTVPTMNIRGSNLYSKFCYFLFENLNTIKGGVCPLNTESVTLNGTKTKSSDGMDWYVFISVSDDFNNNNQDENNADNEVVQFPLSSNLSTTRVIVDVNGSEKGPNCTTDNNPNTPLHFLPTDYNTCSEDTEPDTFIINVRYDGKLRAGCSTDEPCTDPTDETAVDILSAPIDNRKTEKEE